MEISYSTLSYSTYKAEFSATLVQTTAMLMSDIFEVEIEFGWLSNDYAKSNAAFLKIKFFKVDMANIENKVIMMPHPPSNDVIAMMLHSKLNAIVHEYIEVISVKVGSKSIDPVISYTHADNTYPALPELKDWITTDDYYYDLPWWSRNSTDTEDYEDTRKSDLTSVPESDTILDDLEKAILGELKLEQEGGEVVEISDWKPEIIKD